MVKSGYIKVESFMCNDLNLKGNELLVYAIIYGFTKNHKAGGFSSSQEYIANWLSVTRKTVSIIIGNLIEKGLIRKFGVEGRRTKKLSSIELSKEQKDIFINERFDDDQLMLEELSNNSYFVIKTHMINIHNLKGNELMLYAIIENYNCNNIYPDWDQLEYIRYWLSVHNKTFIKALKGLINGGFIINIKDSRGNIFHSSHMQLKYFNENVKNEIEKEK